MTTSVLGSERSDPKVERARASRVFGGAMVGGAAAAVLNVALWFAARSAGAPLTARFDPAAAVSELPVGMVAVASLVPALFAALAMLVLRAFVTNANRVFVAIGVVFGALSMGGPATLAEATLSTKLVLAVMHVVAAAAIVAGIVRANRSR